MEISDFFNRLCIKAWDIQNHWPGFVQIGDHVIHKHSNKEGYVDEYEPSKRFVVNGEECYAEPFQLFYWIPTLEQLKEMVEYTEENFDSFVTTEVYDPNSPSEAPARYHFGAEEEQLVAYVMKRRYKKVWRPFEWLPLQENQ